MADVEVTVHMDEEVEAAAEQLFGELGMDLDTAVNVFVRQALREGGIPFPVTVRPRHGRPAGGPGPEGGPRPCRRGGEMPPARPEDRPEA